MASSRPTSDSTGVAPGGSTTGTTAKKHKQTVAQIIAEVAREKGIPPAVALALGMYESGLNPNAVGDKGTSFGIYQLHEGGELGSHTQAWAENVRHNAETALSVLASVHADHPDWDWGRIAAAAQRPADQPAEADAVNGYVEAFHASNDANPVAYFESQSAKAATPAQGSSTGADYSAGGGGAPAGNNQYTKGDVNAAINSLGISKALINSDPSLKAAFDHIIANRLDPNTSAGRARIQQILQDTEWWKSRSASQRRFDEMSKDPARRQELEAQLAQKRADVRTASTQLGINLDADTLHQIAHAALRSNLDDNQVQRMVAGQFEYSNGENLTGQAGADVEGLKQMAGEYYVGLPDDRIEKLATRMLANGLSPDAMKSYFQDQALSRFPNLTKQINSGLTVADIAAPYQQAMSNILEVPSTQIAPRDQTIMKALQQPDGNGGFQLMPEWQFENMLRNDPRWLSTQNAHDSLLGLGHDLLKSFGLAV